MGEQQLDDEETALLWQDILDEIGAGRTQNHRCPFCIKGEIAVTRDDQTKRTRVECRACRRFIDVRITNADPQPATTSSADLKNPSTSNPKNS